MKIFFLIYFVINITFSNIILAHNSESPSTTPRIITNDISTLAQRITILINKFFPDYSIETNMNTKEFEDYISFLEKEYDQYRLYKSKRIFLLETYFKQPEQYKKLST